SPFSIQIQLAPREKSPVTKVHANPRNSVTYRPCFTSAIIFCGVFVQAAKRNCPPDCRRASQSTRCISSSLQSQLFSHVSVKQIGFQNALVDYDGASRGHSLRIERRAAKTAFHRAIVNDSDIRSGNLLAE